MRYAVIMAGGSGTRLWPISRQGKPKQLLKLFNSKSLLQLAYERASQVVEPSRILVCTSAAYADEVFSQLPELTKENLLGEPEGRDSLNAVAWPAAVIAKRDANAVVATLTADQLIQPVDEFVSALETAFQLAAADDQALVTFGVMPTSAHTGYGYLERGEDIAGYRNVSSIREFKEKPDLETAEKYLASGRYWWNAGMFVWQAKTLLEQLQVLQPATYQAVKQLAEKPEILNEIYPKLFKTSVDYAIMEPVSHGKTSAHVLSVGLAINWLDVGSYQSLFEALKNNDDANAGFGPQICRDANNNLIINTDADNTLIAVAGVNDLVVVRTDQITLVAPLAASQEIKPLAGQVAAQISQDLS